MNSGTTMIRVYAALKDRIMSGSFSAGERLDPVRLAGEHASSATPVRDALFRLTGERLIESWQQEGFRMPLVTEGSLRDLYNWSAELMALAVRMATHPAIGSSGGADDDAPDDIAIVFNAIALATGNYEVRAAVSNLNDRSGMFRHLEGQFLIDEGEVGALAEQVSAQNWVRVRELLVGYHRRRLRIVPNIAALLRPRDGMDR